MPIIYLIGPMAAGKTSVGRKLAKRLRYDFIDTDQALEKRTGVSVGRIFEIEGEAGFRAREAKMLAEIGAQGGEAVVATGGGIILREENRRVLRTGTVVYLRAALEALWERLHDCQTRPLLNVPNPKQALRELLEAREPLYAGEADHIVAARVAPTAVVAARIHKLLRPHECDEDG